MATVTIADVPEMLADLVQQLGGIQALDGGGVLPGFKLPLARLFARARRRKARSASHQALRISSDFR